MTRIDDALAWAEGRRLDASGACEPPRHAKTLAIAYRSLLFDNQMLLDDLKEKTINIKDLLESSNRVLCILNAYSALSGGRGKKETRDFLTAITKATGIKMEDK